MDELVFQKTGIHSDFFPPRTFLTRSYPTMKKNNPDTPILIREAQGTLPKIYARYGSSIPPRLSLIRSRNSRN